MTIHSYPRDYHPYFNKMNQAALKIGHKVMFDFLSHYHENECISNICDYMSTIFTFSDSWVGFVKSKGEEPSLICTWIQENLLADQCAYFFHIMFKCPDNNARQYIGRIVGIVLNKAFSILAACSEKEAERDHPKVKLLRDTIDSFMTLVLDVIHTKDCQKEWVRLE